MLLSAGENTLTVTVPDEATIGMVGEVSVERFARFRFSSMAFASVSWLAGSGESGFGGLAYDGEVEDYQFEILRYEKDWGDAPLGPDLGQLPVPHPLGSGRRLALHLGALSGYADRRGDGRPADGGRHGRRPGQRRHGRDPGGRDQPGDELRDFRRLVGDAGDHPGIQSQRDQQRLPDLRSGRRERLAGGLRGRERPGDGHMGQPDGNAPDHLRGRGHLGERDRGHRECRRQPAGGQPGGRPGQRRRRRRGVRRHEPGAGRRRVAGGGHPHQRNERHARRLDRLQRRRRLGRRILPRPESSTRRASTTSSF